MNSPYLKYLKNLLIFSGIFGSIILIIRFLVPGNYLSPALPFLFIFFIASSLLSFYYLLQSTKKRFSKFVNTFLLTILIKLFLYGGVMITYVLLHRIDAIPFLLGFFMLYLGYTAFESVSIIKYTRPAPPDQTIH